MVEHHIILRQILDELSDWDFQQRGRLRRINRNLVQHWLERVDEARLGFATQNAFQFLIEKESNHCDLVRGVLLVVELQFHVVLMIVYCVLTGQVKSHVVKVVSLLVTQFIADVYEGLLFVRVANVHHG